MARTKSNMRPCVGPGTRSRSPSDSPKADPRRCSVSRSAVRAAARAGGAALQNTRNRPRPLSRRLGAVRGLRARSLDEGPPGGQVGGDLNPFVITIEGAQYIVFAGPPRRGPAVTAIDGHP